MVTNIKLHKQHAKKPKKSSRKGWMTILGVFVGIYIIFAIFLIKSFATSPEAVGNKGQEHMVVNPTHPSHTPDDFKHDDDAKDPLIPQPSDLDPEITDHSTDHDTDDSTDEGTTEPAIPSVTKHRLLKDELYENDKVSLNYNVFTFYYAWYDAPFDSPDGKKHDYMHWNHQILDDHKHICVPPEEIGANVYPSLGLYSSYDEEMTDVHFQMIADSGIGVVVISYWPDITGSESQGSTVSDDLMDMLFRVAQKHSLKVSIHLEPFKGRSLKSMTKVMKHISDRWGKHASIHKIDGRISYFVYDSYLVSKSTWSKLVSTTRGKPHAPYLIGLLVKSTDIQLLTDFDALYSYFAVDGFTYGSTSRHWRGFVERGSQKFIPCVGPGYIDEKIRPWNRRNTRTRSREYYRKMWDAAIASGAEMIAITSFNEWHEGTVIEPALCDKNGYVKCANNDNEVVYLDQTRLHVSRFSSKD
ncbi:hypothetical protein PCE1_001714 [Barthelona sp. PCE]